MGKYHPLFIVYLLLSSSLLHATISGELPLSEEPGNAEPFFDEGSAFLSATITYEGNVTGQSHYTAEVTLDNSAGILMWDSPIHPDFLISSWDKEVSYRLDLGSQIDANLSNPSHSLFSVNSFSASHSTCDERPESVLLICEHLNYPPTLSLTDNLLGDFYIPEAKVFGYEDGLVLGWITKEALGDGSITKTTEYKAFLSDKYSTPAPVPLPAGLWLFCSALIAIVQLKRA